MKKYFTLVLLMAATVAHATVESRAPEYRATLDKKVRESIALAKSAATDALRIAEIEKLKAWLAEEKSRVRVELQAAKATSKSKAPLADLDGRDSEMLILWYTLEPVFDGVLSPAFSKNAEFKRGACRDMVEDVTSTEEKSPVDPARTEASQHALAIAEVVCGKPDKKSD